MKDLTNKCIAAVMIITAALNVACQNNKMDKGTIKIDLSKGSLSNIEDVFSEIDICYLDSTEDAIISGVVLSCQMNDDIMIVEGSEGILYVYDYFGHYIGSSKRTKGNGHGEFNVFTGYSYNNYTKRVEIVTPNELLFYDTSFNFLGKKKIPTESPQKDLNGTFFRQIYDISESKHILLTSPIERKRNEFFTFDSNIAKEEDNISYNSYEIAEISMQEQSFYELNKTQYLFFPPCLTNKAFIYDNNSRKIKPYIEYIGTDLINTEDVKQYKNNRNKMLEYLTFKCEKIIPLRGLGNNDVIYTFFKAGGTTRETYTSIFYIKDKTSKNLKNRTETTVKIPVFNKIKGDTLYALVTPEDVKKMKHLSILNQKSKQLIEKASDETNYALARYTLSKK